MRGKKYKTDSVHPWRILKLNIAQTETLIIEELKKISGNFGHVKSFHSFAREN